MPGRAPQRVKDRIAAARGKRPKLRVPYVIPHPNHPDVADKILCKLCDSALRTLIPDDRFLDVQVIGTQTLRTQRLIMATTPSYQEVEFTFDDLSKHVTPMCKSCAVRMNLEDAEVVYSADMEQARLDEDAGQGDVRWELWENRQVTGFRMV